ncbi:MULTISPECIES: hypothetical protein [Cupriavidus]
MAETLRQGNVVGKNGIAPEASRAQTHAVLDYTDRLREAAIRLQLTCLDDDWQGWQVKYRFQCSRGHLFHTRPSTVIHAVDCPACAEVRRMDDLHAAAARAGVVCLEAQWLGARGYHRFRCPKGHQWARRGADAKLSATCPRCNQLAAGRRSRDPDGLERLRQAAARHGGKCLSTSYEGRGAHYRFRCSEGHTWEATAISVLSCGTWCRPCSMRAAGEAKRALRGLSSVQAAVTQRGGVLLDTVYRGVKATYRIRCQAGHEWAAQGSVLVRGGWCRACAIEKRKLTLADAQQAADARGGQCLSTAYHNNATKLHWLCHRGHAWHATIVEIRRGHWCPECAHMNRITNPKSKAWRRYRAAPHDA